MTPDQILAEMERWADQRENQITDGCTYAYVSGENLIEHMREWFREQEQAQ